MINKILSWYLCKSENMLLILYEEGLEMIASKHLSAF